MNPTRAAIFDELRPYLVHATHMDLERLLPAPDFGLADPVRELDRIIWLDVQRETLGVAFVIAYHAALGRWDFQKRDDPGIELVDPETLKRTTKGRVMSGGPPGAAKRAQAAGLQAQVIALSLHRKDRLPRDYVDEMDRLEQERRVERDHG